MFLKSTEKQGADINIVSLMGIAYDEPIRIKKHIQKPNVFLPLVATGMLEKDCYKWCEENDLLSPIYSGATRGGCWFCHNQGVDQLRKLRKEYPDLWQLLLKWDNDSPVTFHTDGHTVHDFDRRFKAEDEGFNKCGERFKWDSLENQQYNIFHYFNDDGSFKENNLMNEKEKKYGI